MQSIPQHANTSLSANTLHQLILGLTLDMYMACSHANTSMYTNNSHRQIHLTNAIHSQQMNIGSGTQNLWMHEPRCLHTKKGGSGPMALPKSIQTICIRQTSVNKTRSQDKNSNSIDFSLSFSLFSGGSLPFFLVFFGVQFLAL